MPLHFDIKDGVALITLSRPEIRNAWCDEFKEAIVARFPELERDPEVRCVVITGDEAGKAFSAGADLKKPGSHTVPSMGEFLAGIPDWRRAAVNVVAEFPKPVIAAVNGHAIGVGCVLTLCADLVVASERAQWRMPQVRLGISPAYAAWPRLARVIGRGQAMKMAMGFAVDATEAYRIGLAQWLVPHEQLMDKALEIAREIASLPPLATRLNKESLVRGQEIGNLSEAALVDVYRLMALELTEDKTEAHQAWKVRRPGKYKAR